MRPARTCVVLFSLFFAVQVVARQTTSPSGTTLLQQALAALAPSTTISDVTLSGTATRIAGSDNESGTVVIKALAGTGSLLSLTLPSGPRTELRNIASVPIAGSWSGPDGVSHAMAYANLLTDPAWFPAFTVSALLSAPNAVITYIGPETRNGQSVIHVSSSQLFGDPSADAKTAALMQHLTQTDVYLDPTTSLPVAIVYAAHADNNALVDIPVELDFSSYQTVSGAQIPFHVQKLFNNGLLLDLQFTSAVLNSGLSSSIFTVGGAQ
jgi:hypothetical protein